ncbi:hypothetical protein PUNSTDRAFT_47662 [Punctularia strigosozonata HHB-11173 SS5]|uniref:N-acetyltransferase domain-containing protein n=1 Tax=Punctularia strigosozonata (strain HHB-11173) TaxID=741275 RepID=R7S4E9_PUNST|nr:uncharacterized protein PUNSTDRAFT_47662 [Punctularia strigosozonata HHB-11173 SS5]EIN04126.1 hypothetical protein PUNSTDRAFT_47662 [Punctularia strigosozonata HHB-11173 SS5]
MSAIQVRHAAKPTSAELDRAATVLEQAFKDDAFVNACIGGDQSLNFAFQRATIAATAIGGQLCEDQGEAGFNELLEKKFPPELSQWWTFLPKYEQQVEHALGEGQKLASWHLQMFGVLPELQNKGIGTALMQAIVPKAHAEGKAVVLETETERNMLMYKHWKYESKSHEQYENVSGGFPISRKVFSSPSTPLPHLTMQQSLIIRCLSLVIVTLQVMVMVAAVPVNTGEVASVDDLPEDIDVFGKHDGF